MPSAVTATPSTRLCEGCGTPELTATDRFCATCGRQLPLPGTPAAAVPQPAIWHPVGTPERSTPVALIVGIAAVLVVAFAGAAVAIILAVSNGDGISPTTISSAGQPTVTVISHGP